MSQTKNILFIMCDQLRWDYLSFTGHPHLQTPNIDKLAQRGIYFNRAYTQSPLCCPSRASTYTGRYVSSHGTSTNFAYIRADELGIGDYLQPLGVRTAVVGKTHSFVNPHALERLQIDPQSDVAKHLANIGFEPYWRDDGLHPNNKRSENTEYNRYLREKGYDDINPWNKYANGAIDENGEWVNGWFLKAGTYPADIAEPDSETPFATQKAMQFIDEAGETPWCLHLSFIKPHWPYIAPPPYHDMYPPSTFLPLVRDEGELDDPHPIFEAYTQMDVGRGFQRPEARAAVMQAYMGLIKQIDDQLGELFAFIDERGLTDNTMIVFTSDHGDYLGDHWMGEKSWFHDCAVKVPLIIVDPSPAADATRGTVSDALVEQIDLVPTFIETLGGNVPTHRLEGHSLRPFLEGKPTPDWRTFAISEMDISDRGPKFILDLPDERCHTIMVCTAKWKYIHTDQYRPLLFDLENDPAEIADLGADTRYASVIAEMQRHLLQFMMRRKFRISFSEEEIAVLVKPPNAARRGIYIGYYDESDLPPEVRPTKE